MPIRLQEGLLGQILCVVVVADAVVGIAVHVAQMRPIQLGELGVELRLRLLRERLGHSCPTLSSGRSRPIAHRGARTAQAARTSPSELWLDSTETPSAS